MIKKYFANIGEQISLFQNIINNHSLVFKHYSRTKGYISGDIIFIDNSRLSFKEVKDIETENKDKYSYNYIDHEDKLIFRYDNANHYPSLKTFPHHKHLQDTVNESEEPELIDVLIEISKYIENT